MKLLENIFKYICDCSWYSGVKKSGFRVHFDRKGSHEILQRHEVQKFVKQYSNQTNNLSDQSDLTLEDSDISETLVSQEQPKKIVSSTEERKRPLNDVMQQGDVSSLSGQTGTN
jgi:hypothetical protein